MTAADSRTDGRTRSGQELALLTPAEVARLIYELEVHQIELELQNEELRETQVTLEAARERYFDLYNLAPVGYLTVSEDGLIAEANLAASAQLGMHRRRLVGQRFTHFIQPEDQDVFYLLIRRPAAESKPQSCELRLLRQDGSSFWARLETTAERGHERHALVYRVTISDISDRKRAELLLQEANAHLEQQVAARTAELQTMVTELQRANIGKDAFLAAVSHELRTPLTGVLSMGELLQLESFGPLNPAQARYVTAMLKSGQRLVATVDSILLYTSLVAGSTPIENETCCLHELCTIATGTVVADAAAKQQRITQEVSPIDLQIESDPQAIARVLKILLANAVKFTPEGGCIDLTVTQEDDAVRMVVADNGIGMSDEQMSNVLRPFAQGDQTLARRFEGLGLGLAYVREMVTRLGGTLTVTSEPDRGSRFTVTLPLHLPL